MSAGYNEPRVSLVTESRCARVEFQIRNTSQDTWRSADGWAVGYHLFDSATGTLIVDGARTAVDLAPGAATHVSFDVDLPLEDGRYQIFFSPLQEGVCWYYERRWPLLLVEATVRDGAIKLGSPRVATKAAISRSSDLRSIGRAITYPVLTVWRNRSLIRVMIRRDVLGRYRGSFGGSFWTVFNPLLLMLTYFFVFGVILNKAGESKSEFALYYIAGVLPWLAFSEAAGRAPTVILEHRNFVKKLVFAVETLPVNLVGAGLVTEIFAIALFGIFLGVFRHALPGAMIWLPLLLIPQILFTAGVAWFLAALGAFVRDLGQVIGFLLTVWFFITPICYREEPWRAATPGFLSKNPIYILVRGYRAIFLDNTAPAFGPLWKLWLVSAVVCILGHAWFYKLRKSFPDVI